MAARGDSNGKRHRYRVWRTVPTEDILPAVRCKFGMSKLEKLRFHLGRGYKSVAFSTDGRRLANGDADGNIIVRDLTSGQVVLKVRENSSDIFSVAFSPDGARIASGGEDNRLRLWDATSGEKLLELGHSGGVHSVAFSPNGRVCGQRILRFRPSLGCKFRRANLGIRESWEPHRCPDRRIRSRFPASRKRRLGRPRSRSGTQRTAASSQH